jgi:putative addiction module component (TIGR02574 family)
MTALEIMSLSPVERLDLIGRLWDSLDQATVPLTQVMAEELDRRMASADADLAQSVPWEAIRSELVRHRS